MHLLLPAFCTQNNKRISMAMTMANTSFSYNGQFGH